MKPKTSLRQFLLLVGSSLLAVTSVHAQGTFSVTTTPPAFDGADQGYLNPNSPSTATGLDKWFAENSGAGQTKGQTFTLTGDVLLNSITYRLAATQAQPTKVYVVRIGAINTLTNTFIELHSEEITQTVDWGVGNNDSFGTWTLQTPITLPALPAGTLYGVDVAMKSSTSGWQTGIPYPLFENSDVFAGGYKYTRPLNGGVTGSATEVMQNDGTRDREFHLDMTTTTVTDTTAPNLVSINDQVGGGPIYEDQVQVTYILNFDEAIDASTIDLTDFENLGTGVSLDSVVSVTPLTPFPTPSSIRVVLGISGTGTLQLGVKSTTNIADNYTNILANPSGDDTTITVNSGSNPAGGNRFWDGAITTGVTDGVSQGGSGTWDTTTTNWDRGFGFAGPVAWNNANNDLAILGGANGTVTLAEPITVGGLQIDNRNIDIVGSTLTFGVAGVINSTSVGNQNDPPIISSTVSGAAVTKTGAGYINLTGNNDFAAFTLSAGTLGQLPGGTYTGIGTGLFTINGGGLFVTNNDATTIDNDMVWNGNWFSQNVSNAAKTTTFNGDVSLGASITISSKHAQVFNGIISDGGNNHKLTLTNSGGGSTITLSNANTFGGGVQVNQGTLNINNASAIGSGTFTISGATTINNTSGNPITLSTNNVQAWNNNITFTGSNDLNLGTGAVTMNNNRIVTVNAGTLTVGGAIGQSGGNRTLGKAGNGTLVLSGANSYAGNTTVTAGTLALVGGSQNSAITVNSGASLGFTLGSPTTSTKALTLSGGHAIAITGAVDNASDYPLMTASAITGIPTLAAPIIDHELQLREGGTELWLAYTGVAGSPYDTWSDGTFANGTLSDKAQGADPDNDGLTNLQEFAFGTDPTVSFAGSITWVAGGAVTTAGSPVAVNLASPGVDFRAVYGRRKDYVAAGLTYTVQFSADLANWVDNTDAPTVLTDDATSDIDAVSVPYPLFITTPNGSEKPTYFRVGVTID